MIAGVMRIADLVANTPREIRARLRGSRRSRLPVRDGDDDNIIGVITVRDILSPGFLKTGNDLRAMVQETLVVRDGLGALEVIQRLRHSPSHIVLVYDEYGHFEGIITAMDVLEAITGEFSDEVTDEPKMVTKADGLLLVAGWMPLDEFAEHLNAELPANRDYETVAGMVLELTGHLPLVGERLIFGGWTIEVIDLDGRRIDKVLVSRSH